MEKGVIRLLERHRYSDGIRLDMQQLAERISRFPMKYAWFMKQNYVPHYWQTLFHTMSGDDNRILRFRNLVAGRRGGKTLGCAWDVACYSLNPHIFHMDVHGEDSREPLHGWILVPNYKAAGRAAIRTLTYNVLTRGCGMQNGKEFKFNKGDLTIEFLDGTFIEFKTAEQADTLVGAGLDFLWIDEAAVIGSQDAYDYASPALDDKLGIVLGSTTPRGKNWYYELFWELLADDPDVGSVEFRSIDNPHFPRKAWEYRKKTYHPLLFKQEYMAAFDAMAGRELAGDWLKYYTLDEIPRVEGKPNKFNLTLFMGVDPAISLADTADRFSMALIGVSKDGQVFLLEQFADRIPFPDQVLKIQEWHIKYRPQYIGIESNAYQAALAQQTVRLSSIPPIIEIKSKGKKSERLLSMAPLFRIGKVRLRKEMKNFIDEWLDYDSTVKNPRDDCLDSVEIALRTAGVLLPEAPDEEMFSSDEMPPGSIEELAWRLQRGQKSKSAGIDEHLGGEW